jgi:uncharacterized membrane protein
MLHLFHPALVHFSAAFLIAGACCEIAGLAVRREPLARWGAHALVAGAASLLPTIVSGYLAANSLDLPARAATLLAAHERNGLILLGLVVAGLFWKAWYRGRVPDSQRLAYFALLAAVVLLTAWSAWLGGRMVYGEGVGVLLGRSAS